MKKRILLFLSLIFSISAAAVVAQETRTVTDSDLEKFRQKRLAAEKDYRENYARLGFPSPQELEKRISESKRELDELSARFESERIEREKASFWRSQADLLAAQSVLPASESRVVERNYYYGYAPYFYSPGYYNRPRYRSNYDRRRRYWRNYGMPPIRPPKPIRPPRFSRWRNPRNR